MDISRLDNELSEVSSKLMMRDKELVKLKENNKQLIQKLHDKKLGETVSQVMLY